MKIAIDCRSLRKKNAGTSNFLVSVINYWSAHQPEWTFYLLSNERFSAETQAVLSTNPNIIPIIRPLPVFKNIATAWYLLKVYFILKALKADIFFTPTPNLPWATPPKVKLFITVHDLVYKLYPQTMSRSNYGINFLLFNYSVKKADRIWAVSQYTKNEIIKFFPKRPPEQIFVGSSIDQRIFHHKEIPAESKSQLLQKYQISEKFLLFVGTIEPRKNLQFLLSLMPALSKHGFYLLIVGAKGWKNSRIETIIKQPDFPADKVVFSGFVTNEELVSLYHTAALYVSTALNEGFGLPQLEAMSCGCPVVTAHNSAMIEIAENAGKTVKGWEHHTWIEAILHVYEHRDLYIQKGFIKAQKYNWENIIYQFTNFIQKCEG